MPPNMWVPDYAPLDDLAVLAACPRSDRLPDDLAVGTEAELLAIG
jgi:hypothetical protein